MDQDSHTFPLNLNDNKQPTTKGKLVMGDRANIAVKQENGDQIWLYSHWGGSELPARLKTGLAAGKGRWQDESYLTKIIFGHAVPADNWIKETGYGISGRMQDNGYPILVVDIPKQRVFTMSENQLKDFKVPSDFEPALNQVWVFADYCTLKKLPWGDTAEE